MHKRLTYNSQRVINQLKKSRNQNDLAKIDAFFLLEKIKNCKGCLGKTVLDSFGITLKEVVVQKDKDTSAKKAVSEAVKLAYANKSPYVGTEHLVQSILSMPGYSDIFKEQEQTMSPLIKIIDNRSGNSKGGESQHHDYFGEISSMIENYFSPAGVGQMRQKKQSLLENYCINLNDSRINDHVIVGREGELERVSHILGRKMKNNPVLIGEPGVGKTAIVEGLAQNIRKRTAPYYLSDKKIMSLDMGLLIAGTTFRGEFEARLKEIVGEIKRNPNIILFIDEIHNLVGAGNAIGGMDAANLLKPVLSRGEIQIIGATTIDEYQKHIEKDAALERRFQPIVVDEPRVEETAQILLGIKPSYEKYHNVTITKEACMAAASLAKRYITDRFLPDSAIDLIDETAARLRSNLSASSIYKKVKRVEQKRNTIISEKESLVMNDHYEQAIRMREEEKKVSQLLRKLKKQLKDFEDKHPTTIDQEDIRTTLSITSRIPQELLSGQDKQLAKNVQTILSEKLIGQNHANKRIINSVLRQVSGISSPNRPLGSFLFVGPSGVGKTHAAKLLAQAISPDGTETLIQINMSEFMEKHTASRLLGAPAGYVGYEEGGELTDKIKRKPYSVVLFDEIEKAEPTVLNILLQILEEGELADSKGRRINFRNTIIAMTSNIGTADLEKLSEMGFATASKRAQQEKEKVQQSIVAELQEVLLPEFINRLDDVLIFNHLEKKDIKKIITLEMEQLKSRLKEKSISISVSQKALDHLSEQALDTKQGARLVRKIMQDQVEPIVAKLVMGKSKINKIEIILEKNKLLAKKG